MFFGALTCHGTQVLLRALREAGGIVGRLVEMSSGKQRASLQLAKKVIYICN